MKKWIVILLAIAAIYYLFRNDFRHKKSDVKEKKAKMAENGELVKDPTCGTYVAIDGSISVKDGNITHRFCSYECRDAFLKKLEQSGREIPHIAKSDSSDEAAEDSSTEQKL